MFYAYKKIWYMFLKVGAIPCGCNSTSTILDIEIHKLICMVGKDYFPFEVI